jgi:hypothetical protein
MRQPGKEKIGRMNVNEPFMRLRDVWSSKRLLR